MLDIATAYNKYKFLGNDYLTWIWFLIENNHKPFEEQKEILLNKLKEYQGNDQRNDDITVIGFKV